MGNRAVLTFSTAKSAPCIYLHWNGGRASVEGFLQAARDLGLRHAGDDHHKTMDGLAQMIVRHFFGCDLGRTVYRMRYDEADIHGNNGTYVLSEDMTIKRRMYRPYAASEEETSPSKTVDIIEHITVRAPIFND